MRILNRTVKDKFKNSTQCEQIAQYLDKYCRLMNFCIHRGKKLFAGIAMNNCFL